MSDYILKAKHTELRNHEIPEVFKHLSHPPKELYIVGDPEVLSDEGLAIVGARNASPYGLSAAKHFAGIAAKAGVTIVSGGALGCDSASHKAAIEAGGRTVVFLGGGCHELYPARNTKLFEDVVKAGGALVSEVGWNIKARPYNFRERNRLIAAISKAVLVVQAGIPSGTFTTADYAISCGKDVWSIPGPITYSGSAGCNRLIQQGAAAIIDDDTFYDRLLELFGVMRPEGYVSKASIDVKKGEKLDESNNPVLEAIMAQPMTMEQLYDFACTKAGKENPGAWMSRLLVEAEMTGKICRYFDGTYGPVVT